MAPKDYKSFVDMGESTAEDVWSQIAFKHPTAKIV